MDIALNKDFEIIKKASSTVLCNELSRCVYEGYKKSSKRNYKVTDKMISIFKFLYKVRIATKDQINRYLTLNGYTNVSEDFLNILNMKYGTLSYIDCKSDKTTRVYAPAVGMLYILDKYTSLEINENTDEYVFQQNINNSFINKEAKKTENKENEFVEETLSATDSPEQTTETLPAEQKNTAQPEETTEAVEETTAQVDISTLTPMEVNALFVKTNYSLIKPLEGEITSRFGHREPTVPTVPKNHTGIDIAEDIGKIIVASMEGDVTLVSSEGDYGNHIKITNGEVTTVYAHCSKIYVKEGEHIVQGQQIAEVGATGNVTGPHLHFEIRRNNEYIDPDLVLQF